MHLIKSLSILMLVFTVYANSGDALASNPWPEELSDRTSHSIRGNGGSQQEEPSKNSTHSRIYEWALGWCDKFIYFMGTVAADVPPYMHARPFHEVDFSQDTLFWQGMFNAEIDSLKESQCLSQSTLEKLIEWQDIVYASLLSPRHYESGLRELTGIEPADSIENIRKEFHNKLHNNSKITKSCLQSELLDLVKDCHDNADLDESTKRGQLGQTLAYYKDLLNALDYTKNLNTLLMGLKTHKKKLSLTEEQYQGFVDVLSGQVADEDELYPELKTARVITAYNEAVDKTKKKKKATLALKRKQKRNHSVDYYSLWSFINNLSRTVSSVANHVIENPFRSLVILALFQPSSTYAKVLTPKELERICFSSYDGWFMQCEESRECGINGINGTNGINLASCHVLARMGNDNAQAIVNMFHTMIQSPGNEIDMTLAEKLHKEVKPTPCIDSFHYWFLNFCELLIDEENKKECMSLSEITLNECLPLAEQGDAIAQNNVARLHRAMENHSESLYWINKAIAQNHWDSKALLQQWKIFDSKRSQAFRGALRKAL